MTDTFNRTPPPKRRPSLGPIAAVQDLADIRGVLPAGYRFDGWSDQFAFGEEFLRCLLLHLRHFFIVKVRDYED